MINKHSRQSFLGNKFIQDLSTSRVGVVGLGGGGSVIINSLAHIGFEKYFICDPDKFEESNINRLLGATFSDIKNKPFKTEIAKRVIQNIIPHATVDSHQSIWQKCITHSDFQNCKIIFSCLDDFSNRIQIEAFARRHKIPLVDIGLKIKNTKLKKFNMMGQVVLSHPKGPCFKCYNFITDEDLSKEANNYGDAGTHPQVIWANSVLANTAIGVGVNLLSKWSETPSTVFYKHFDGNQLTCYDSLKVEYKHFDPPFSCPHF